METLKAMLSLEDQGLCEKHLWLALGAVGAIVTVYVVVKGVYRYSIRRHLRSLTEQHREQCEESLQQLRARIKKVPKDRVDYLTSLSTEELCKKIQNKEVSSIELLRAFQVKALAAHEISNCLVEEITGAEDVAKQCDESKDRKGILYGLPISIKEVFALEGYSHNRGTSSLIPLIPKEDCVLVQVLKGQGAVPFVRTNAAQLGLSLECSNPIHGAVLNPADPSRTSGGSSGGEAALIAQRGSFLGWGSDLGGSIRVPASFCGIVGLRPTGQRISDKGLLSPQTLVPVSYGPMGWDVDSVVLAMKAVLVPEMYQLDPSIPYMPFRYEVYNKKGPMKIGYYMDDGVYPITPACMRAVELTKKALEKQGHQLVPWTPPRPEFAQHIFAVAASGDGGRLLMDGPLKYADLDPCSLGFYEPSTTTGTLKKMMKILYYKYTNPKMAKLFLRHKSTGSVAEYFMIDLAVQKYRHEVMDSWREAGLDAAISTTFPVPATKLGSTYHLSSCHSLLAMYNLLNFPAGVVPVTKVTQEDINNMADWPQRDGADTFIKETMTEALDLPVSVQCIALQWQEEMCLRLMKEVESAIKDM